MTRLSSAATVLGTILLAACVVKADDNPGGNPGSYAVNGDSTAVLLMPELKGARAPAWLKPGMRLTWYGGSASIPGARIAGLKQDPDGKWVSVDTGQQYDCQEAAGGAGHGFSQLDVLAVHDDIVVVDMSMYIIEGLNGAVRLSLTGAFNTPPAYCADFWVNPDLLAKHLDIAGPRVLAARTKYNCADQIFDAFWINLQTEHGSTNTVADLKSGIMLHEGLATYTPSGTAVLNGLLTSVGGHTDLAQNTFRGKRQLQIPWAGNRLPESIANLHKLTYNGVMTTAVPGCMPISFRTHGEVSVTGRGRDFLQARRTNTIEYGNGAAPFATTAEMVTGPNQITPLAIPPEHLARFKRGQVIDVDPTTHISTTVSFIGRDQRGSDVVTLTCTQGNGAVRVDFIYDRMSGILCGVVTADPTLFMQTQAFLTARE